MDLRKIVARHMGVAPTDSKVDAHPLMRLSFDTAGAQSPILGANNQGMQPDKWLGVVLFQNALQGGPAVHQAEWDGNLMVPYPKLIETCASVLGLRIVHVVYGIDGSVSMVTLSSDDTMIRVVARERGHAANISMVSSNEAAAQKTAKLFARMLVQDDPKKGLVFILASGMSGYNIRRLGLAGTPLERGNYSEQVLADYDHVVSDFRTESPCGRLIIMSGEPGTGKTYLVRSFLTEVPNAAFILIPPHIVQDLGGPDILPAITQAKNEMNGPIILVIEDADQCLVPRENGDINSISSLLNLGDGILGSVLDIRILATTNANKLQMDAATRREGRLCRHMQVDALSASEAAAAYSRLVNDRDPQFAGPATLAQVYSKARRDGWKPSTKAVPERAAMKPYLV